MITVKQLIHDLQPMPPQARVDVALCEIVAPGGHSSMSLCDDDAAEADEVRYMGGYVLIRSK